MNGDLLCWDTETTGVDVFEDRIVTIFVGVLHPDGTWGETLNLLVDPGVEIPEGASEVHGITTEYARDHGMQPYAALRDVAEMMRKYRDLPWVIMNANYDISLLMAEIERHWTDPVEIPERIYDPLVMDRHYDRYRRGKRKLVNLAEHYNVEVDESKAHDAAYDCYLAGNVTRAIIAKYGDCTVAQQAEWQEEWRAHFEEYLRKSDPSAIVERGWPVRERSD